MKKLNKIFNPKSIAIIGANSREDSVGRGLVKNALEGRNLRKIFCINPFEKEVLGIKCLSKITEVKENVDLAIIAVKAKIVPKIVKECCRKRVGGMIIISAGFGEIGKEGKKIENEIVKIVRRAKIPLIGPNTLGIIRPSIKLNASFAPATPKSGNIAFLSQSGALLDSIIDKSLNENYGFSTIISLGNQSDLTISDFLEFLENDKETKVIAVYLEGIRNGRRFLKVAKRVSKKKPIIIIKAGRTEKGKKAVSTHTGSLAGEYQIYKAVFKQTGVIEVNSVEELLDIAKALSWQPRTKNGIGIITNGGGVGVLSADYCQDLKINLPELKKETIKKIENSGVMHPAWSKRNPVDIVGDALPTRYKVAIEALLKQKNIYGLIIIETLQIMTKPIENAKIIIEAKKKWKEKPIICAFLGGKMSEKGIKILEKNKIPNYSDVKRAVRAMKALVN